MHRHEGGAEAVEARIVLVATRLIDGALAPPFGLERLYRHAVRFQAAIAAALADKIVDDDTLFGIRISPPLATPPLLGSTGLVIDENGHARHGRQHALHRIELVAMMDRQPLGPCGRLRILPRLIY